jgi:hypothetical protein
MAQVKVKSSGLNLRKEPIIADNIVTILKNDNILDVLESDIVEGWTKIRYGIYHGYVSNKFIEPIKEKVIPQMTLAQRALKIAISQLGNSEIPKNSNWGKHVEKYLKSVGINFPAFWCMAFVYWSFDEAAKEMKIKNPLPKTAGVLDMWNRCPKKWRVKGQPQKGDIGIMDYGKGKGHTFIVESSTDKIVQTVEGNSNDEGSRNGYEVCRNPGGRTIKSCIGFIRVPNEA